MAEPEATPEIAALPASQARKKYMWRALVVVSAALISFLSVSQLRGPDHFRQQLASENEGDLARILSSLSGESAALQDELSTLKVQLATLKSSSDQQGTASAQVQAELNSLEVLAGTTPVTGPGIQLTIADPTSAVTYEILVDAVQELRDSGAEAIAINARRVGATSAFSTKDRRILLDNVPLPVPYTIEAIGPAATMEGGLEIPGGAVDSLQALESVKVDIRHVDELHLPAAQATSLGAARPVS